jgi:hypothetical protein
MAWEDVCIEVGELFTHEGVPEVVGMTWVDLTELARRADTTDGWTEQDVADARRAMQRANAELLEQHGATAPYSRQAYLASCAAHTAARARAYRLEHLEQERAAKRVWRAAHAEHEASRRKAHRAAHLDRERAVKQAWYARNKERLAAEYKVRKATAAG